MQPRGGVGAVLAVRVAEVPGAVDPQRQQVGAVVRDLAREFRAGAGQAVAVGVQLHAHEVAGELPDVSGGHHLEHPRLQERVVVDPHAPGDAAQQRVLGVGAHRVGVSVAVERVPDRLDVRVGRDREGTPARQVAEVGARTAAAPEHVAQRGVENGLPAAAVVGRHVHRGGHVELAEERDRAGGEVLRPVVEREGHGARREGTLAQSREGLA